MPKRLSEALYECAYCKKQFNNLAKADGCEKSHNLIYVPITKPDLLKLIQFIYTGEEKLLTESLMKTLLLYSRAKVTEDDVSNMQD